MLYCAVSYYIILYYIILYYIILYYIILYYIILYYIILYYIILYYIILYYIILYYIILYYIILYYIILYYIILYYIICFEGTSANRIQLWIASLCFHFRYLFEVESCLHIYEVFAVFLCVLQCTKQPHPRRHQVYYTRHLLVVSVLVHLTLSCLRTHVLHVSRAPHVVLCLGQVHAARQPPQSHTSARNERLNIVIRV